MSATTPTLPAGLRWVRWVNCWTIETVKPPVRTLATIPFPYDQQSPEWWQDRMAEAIATATGTPAPRIEEAV